MSEAGAGSSVEDASWSTEVAARAEWIVENVSMQVCTTPLPKPAKPCAPVKCSNYACLGFKPSRLSYFGPLTFFSTICLCGYSINDKSEGRHARAPSPQAASTPPAAWRDDDQFTRALPTNAFGEIEFVNSEQTRAQVHCILYCIVYTFRMILSNETFLRHDWFTLYLYEYEYSTCTVSSTCALATAGSGRALRRRAWRCRCGACCSKCGACGGRTS